MYDYPELNALLGEYEKVKTFTFFVYGEPTEEQVDIINRGLYMRVVSGTGILKDRTVMIVEKINEDTARMLNAYQGTKFLFAFAQNDIDAELIKMTVLEGFEYLRFYAKFIGMQESTSNV